MVSNTDDDVILYLNDICSSPWLSMQGTGSCCTCTYFGYDLAATDGMMKTDGTSVHKHQIYDFKSIGQPSINGNSTVINGTSIVTMKDGPVQDVPTKIALLDGNAISIWIDPSKVNNHFGNTQIFGTPHLICVEEPEYCK